MERGSLQQMITRMMERFQTRKYQMLSIVCMAKGKYYTIMFEDELLDYNNRKKSDDMRLVCRLTARELAQFAKHVNPDLFDKEPNAQRTPDN